MYDLPVCSIPCYNLNLLQLLVTTYSGFIVNLLFALVLRPISGLFQIRLNLLLDLRNVYCAFQAEPEPTFFLRLIELGSIYHDFYSLKKLDKLDIGDQTPQTYIT